MKIGTKGHYALTALLELAQQMVSGKPISLRFLANSQGLSPHYLEVLFCKLKKEGIVKSVRGFQGGYLLSRPPSKISVWDIVTAAGEVMRVNRCEQSSDNTFCFNKKSPCALHLLWEGLGAQIYGYLSQISLEDLINKNFSQKEPTLNFFDTDPTYMVNKSGCPEKGKCTQSMKAHGSKKGLYLS